MQVVLAHRPEQAGSWPAPPRGRLFPVIIWVLGYRRRSVFRYFLRNASINQIDHCAPSRPVNPGAGLGEKEGVASNLESGIAGIAAYHPPLVGGIHLARGQAN